MVYRLVNSTYNVEELILRLTRLVCQFIKADSSSIYLLDPQTGKIEKIAIFDNKINILLTKKKDVAKVPALERRVAQGYPIFDPHCLGLPLIADEPVGAVFIRRSQQGKPFDEFDKDMLSVVAEQSVTAIKNLQLYEEQQKTILGSIEFIGKLLKRRGCVPRVHASTYFKILQMIGEDMHIGKEGIDNLYYASILRDAGAIEVPYDILSKTSRLTPEEFKIIRQQPARSVELIKPVAFLKPVLPIILYHHENYDGTGYPSGLQKDQIPLGARIMSVVDAFEAMITARPYKEPLSIDEAINELKTHSGTQFDPRVVEVFVRLAKQKKFRNYLRNLQG